MYCSTGERKPEMQVTPPDTGTIIRFPEPHHCSIVHTRKLRSKRGPQQNLAEITGSESRD